MTTIEVLNKIAFKETFDDWTHLLIYEEGCTANITSYVQQAMIAYAQQAIEEDRKIVAENACIEKRTFVKGSEEFSSTLDVEFDTRHHRFVIDKDSILNAPKIQLQ